MFFLREMRKFSREIILLTAKAKSVGKFKRITHVQPSVFRRHNFSRRFSPSWNQAFTKFAHFLIVLRAKIVTIFEPKVVTISARNTIIRKFANLVRLYIFHTLQHLSTKFWNFTTFERFFPGISGFFLAWICLDQKLVYNANCPLDACTILSSFEHLPLKIEKFKKLYAKCVLTSLAKLNCQNYPNNYVLLKSSNFISIKYILYRTLVLKSWMHGLK